MGVKNNDADLPMPVSKSIKILGRRFNAKQKIKEFWKNDLITFNDKSELNFGEIDYNKNLTLFEKLKENFEKYEIEIHYNFFEHPKQLQKTKDFKGGVNIYSIIDGKRTHGRECFLITYDYSKLYKLI